MLLVMVVTLLAAVGAALVYLRVERLGPAGLGLALLRTAGIGALVLLLVNPARPSRPGTAPPTVLLDASLSLGAAGGRWREARDSVRALARDGGVVFRFGARVAPADTNPPEDGSSRLADALQLAQGRPGPIVVVTDGEIEDVGTLEPSLLAGARMVVLPRAPVPDAALLEVDVPERLARGDSLPIGLTVGTYGPLSSARGRLEIALGGRVVLRRDLDLPPAPGTARRRVVVSPQALTPGTRLLSIQLSTPGDAEPRDDQRQQWVQIAAQPAVVVLASPANWEMRFLARELSDIAAANVRGFAEIQAGRWVDMHTMAPIKPADVTAYAAGANVLVGAGGSPPRPPQGQAQWRWLGVDSTITALAGDWYVTAGVQPSPLAGRLGAVAWDSLPPLLGLVPAAPLDGQWVALSARLARRGAERPLVLGGESNGARVLVTTGEGLWRWALRGGAAREAYRSLLASGLDWLLGTGGPGGPAAVTAGGAVPHGMPVVFRWGRDSVPDSLQVEVRDGRSTNQLTLRFNAERNALVWLPPGAYRWSARGTTRATGAFVVETYSDEFPPHPVTVLAGGGTRRAGVDLSYARQRPWLFGVVLLALVMEWIWRHQKGLP